jgi:hypothetical protein
MTSYVPLQVHFEGKTLTIPIKVGGRTYASLGFPELKQDPINQSPQEFWESVLYDVRTAWQMWIPSKPITYEGKTFTLPDVLADLRIIEVVKNDKDETVKITVKKMSEWGGKGGKIIFFEGDEYKTSKENWGMPFLSMTWQEVDAMVRIAFMLMETTFTLSRTIEKRPGAREATIIGMTNQINKENIQARRERTGGYEGVEGEGAIYHVDDEGNVYVWRKEKEVPQADIPPTTYWIEPLTYTRTLSSGKEIEVERKEAILVDKKGYTRKEFTLKGKWIKVGYLFKEGEEPKGGFIDLTPAEFLEIVHPPYADQVIGGLPSKLPPSPSIIFQGTKKGNSYIIADLEGKNQFVVTEIGDLELEESDLKNLALLLFPKSVDFHIDTENFQ